MLRNNHENADNTDRGLVSGSTETAGGALDKDSIIKAENVTFEYYRRDEEGNVEGITTAVDNVSLTIKRGDFAAVLGHNGSGKSTFAKHINALLYPVEGTL